MISREYAQVARFSGTTLDLFDQFAAVDCIGKCLPDPSVIQLRALLLVEIKFISPECRLLLDPDIAVIREAVKGVRGDGSEIDITLFKGDQRITDRHELHRFYCRCGSPERRVCHELVGTLLLAVLGKFVRTRTDHGFRCKERGRIVDIAIDMFRDNIETGKFVQECRDRFFEHEPDRGIIDNLYVIDNTAFNSTGYGDMIHLIIGGEFDIFCGKRLAVLPGYVFPEVKGVLLPVRTNGPVLRKPRDKAFFVLLQEAVEDHPYLVHSRTAGITGKRLGIPVISPG